MSSRHLFRCFPWANFRLSTWKGQTCSSNSYWWSITTDSDVNSRFQSKRTDKYTERTSHRFQIWIHFTSMKVNIGNSLSCLEPFASFDCGYATSNSRPPGCQETASAAVYPCWLLHWNRKACAGVLLCFLQMSNQKHYPMCLFDDFSCCRQHFSHQDSNDPTKGPWFQAYYHSCDLVTSMAAQYCEANQVHWSNCPQFQ